MPTKPFRLRQYAKVRSVLFKNYVPPDFAAVIENFSLGKVAPFVGCVRLVGSNRLRFSEDRLENAVLCCTHFGANETHVADLTRVIRYCKRSFFKEYQRDPDLAELSVLLKTVDFWMGSWSGFYTLFNKLSVDESKRDLWSIFEKRITGWMLTEKNTDLDEFWPYFEGALSETMPQAHKLSFKDFLLNRDLWGVSGATDNKEEVHKLLSKTKGGFAYSLSDEQLIKWWTKNRDTIRPWKLVKKEEPGAVRLVVLTDIVSYLKMAYVMQAWDRASAKNPALFAFCQDPQRWWMDRVNDYSRHKRYLLGDYQNFDESATRELIRRYIRYIVANPGLPTDEEFAHLSELENQLYNALVLVPDGEGGEVTRAVLNGLASGLRITTHFNSIFNLAMIRMANSKLGNLSTLVAVLGDDSVNELVGNFTVKQFSEAIAPSGVTLHPRKSYIDSAIEFLKLMVGPFGVRGNPIRALRALLWSSEEEMDVSNPFSAIKLRVSLWTKFLSRCCASFDDVLPMLIQDCALASKVPPSLLKRFLFSPSCVGGGGLAPTNMEKFDPELTVTDNRLPKFSVSHSKILHPYWKRGVQMRLLGLTRSRRAMFDLAIKSLSRRAAQDVWFELEDYQPFRIPNPVSPIRDKISYTFRGLRSKREFLREYSALVNFAPLQTNAASDLFRRFGQRLAVSIINGNDPITMAAPPWATIACGEVLDVMWGRTMTSRLIWNLPNRCSVGVLEALKVEIEVDSHRHLESMSSQFPILTRV